MKFILTRYPTDDGSGIFAAFAEHGPERRIEIPLPAGDLQGELSPAILRDWAWAMLAHLGGPERAAECADDLAASELLAAELHEPIDWDQFYLVITHQEITQFLKQRLTQRLTAAATAG